MGPWNWLDWILAAVVVASIWTAIVKGFVRELISLATVIVGLSVAALGYTRAALWFADLTKSYEIALGLGFLTLFLITLAVGAVVSIIARKLIKTVGFEYFDRFLGGIFGLVRGVIVDCVVVMALLAFAIKPDAVRQSVLAPYLATGARVIVLAMPSSLKQQFQGGLDKFRQSFIQRDQKAIRN